MGSGSDDREEQELRLLIQRVARRIRANRGGDHVSDSQLSTLRRLEDRDNLTPGELASLERVSPPSMNRTVNALEEAGYVVRHPAEGDARKVLVRLTGAGRDVITETRRLRTAWFSARLADLPGPERRRVLDAAEVLRKLADS
jgi:DNA-binding MarR family transcriptional regulator